MKSVAIFSGVITFLGFGWWLGGLDMSYRHEELGFAFFFSVAIAAIFAWVPWWPE